MIIILFIVILLNFCYGFKSPQKLNPITIFSAGFLFANAICIMYMEEWEMNSLRISTFFLIGGGISFFSLFSYFTNRHFRIKYPQKELNLKTLKIPPKYLIVLIIINCLCNYLVYKQIISYSMLTELSTAIAEIDHDFKYGEAEFQLPFLLRNIKFLMEGGCYYLMMSLARHLATNKFDYYAFLHSIYIIISIIGGLLTGSRGGSMTMIIYFIICYFCIKDRLNKSSQLSEICYIKIAVAIIATVLLFYFSTKFIGRSTEDFGIYYLAFYCGAEIKNLDIFINSINIPESNYLGEYTFFSIYNFFDSNIKYNKDILGFNWVGNYMLGNVYTCFQNYYIDFGIVGTFIIISLITIGIQYIYVRATNSTILNYSFFDFRLFLYAFVGRKLALSFFSESAISMINIGTIKICIEIFLISFIINKMFGLK